MEEGALSVEDRVALRLCDIFESKVGQTSSVVGVIFVMEWSDPQPPQLRPPNIRNADFVRALHGLPPGQAHPKPGYAQRAVSASTYLLIHRRGWQLLALTTRERMAEQQFAAPP